MTSLAQQPEDLSHVIVDTTTYCAGIQSVRASTMCSYNLLMEAIPAELPQPCLTGKEGIGGLKQFTALTF